MFDCLINLLSHDPSFQLCGVKPQHHIKFQLGCFLVHYGIQGCNSLEATHKLSLGHGTIGVCAGTYPNCIHILPYPTIPHDLSVSVDSHPFVVTVTRPFQLVIPSVRQLVPYPPSLSTASLLPKNFDDCLPNILHGLMRLVKKSYIILLRICLVFQDLLGVLIVL